MLSDNYFGKDLSDLQLEMATMKFVPKNLLEIESSLYATKWWDYKDMHPLASTYYFAHEYNSAYIKIASCRIETKKITVFRGNFLDRSNQIISGFWKGRQAADKLGIPYWYYCYYALDFSERSDWAYLARPQDMYNKAVIEHVFSKWINYTSIMRIYPEKQDFRHDFAGYYYNDHKKNLLEYISAKYNKKHIIDFCIKERFFKSEDINN